MSVMSGMAHKADPADQQGSALAEYLQVGRRGNMLSRSAEVPTATVESDHDGDPDVALEEGN